MSVFKKKPKKKRKAPKGFHIMPNGQLMSDAAHKPLKLPLRRNAFKQKKEIIKEIWFKGSQQT